MPNKIKYTHTNLIAKNWKKLAQFYIDVFECKPVFPERDLSGEWIDKMTGISDVNICGIHLLLPGFEEGPTLEIFEYNEKVSTSDNSRINNYGFGHLAFHVEDIDDSIIKILKHGGSKYGELIEKEIKGVGLLRAIYTCDPEGNIIEIQNRKKNKPI